MYFKANALLHCYFYFELKNSLSPEVSFVQYPKDCHVLYYETLQRQKPCKMLSAQSRQPLSIIFIITIFTIFGEREPYLCEHKCYEQSEEAFDSVKTGLPFR